MSANELFIAGIGVSKDVVATIVRLAAERVEGVASVGGNDINSRLISVFTARTVPAEAAVTSSVVDDKLVIGVHLAVMFGYPFTKLAEDVRAAIAAAVASQIGVEVASVDVSIDSLVFPKE